MGALWKKVFKHINGLRNQINLYWFKIERITVEKIGIYYEKMSMGYSSISS